MTWLYESVYLPQPTTTPRAFYSSTDLPNRLRYAQDPVSLLPFRSVGLERQNSGFPGSSEFQTRSGPVSERILPDSLTFLFSEGIWQEACTLRGYIYSQNVPSMKRIFLLYSVLLLVGMPQITSAQTLSSAEESVYTLTDAGFLDLYKDYRSETEMYVALFKAKMDEYSPEDVVRMRASYRRTSEAFEDFIYSIRNDFLNKKSRKLIKKNPESYVTEKLEELNQTYVTYYMSRFQPTYAGIVDGESSEPLATASPQRMGMEIPVALIAPLTQATMQVVDFFDKKGARDLETLKEVLENEWIQPHKFRDWDDI